MTQHAARVAIVGARGIGRHHARWWHLAGAEVCAHVGTSEASVATARDRMRELFDYQGRGYTSLEAMLAAEKPDWVDVASTNAAHYRHVRTALIAGAHVLCEKPLVHDLSLTSQELLARTDELLTIARMKRARLGLCSQYWLLAPLCLRLFRDARPGETIRSVTARLASPTRGRAPDPLNVWIDLGPHVIASVQSLAASLGLPAVNLPERPERRFDGYRAECRFQLAAHTAAPLDCALLTHRTEGEPANIRELTLNDLRFELLGENDAQGIFRAIVRYPGGEFRCDDLMHQLIAACLHGKPPIHGQAIRTNQAWLLALAEG